MTYSSQKRLFVLFGVLLPFMIFGALHISTVLAEEKEGETMSIQPKGSMKDEATNSTAPIRLSKIVSKLEQGEQVTIVALGDSNTELTFHTRGHLNWPYLLQEALFERYGPNKVIMINVACCGTPAIHGLNRLSRDVLRFDPDLVIICYWDGRMDIMKTIIDKIRAHNGAEVILRTPNPIIAVNQPPVTPKVTAGKEWPDSFVKGVSEKLVALGEEMDVLVVDHYKSWMAADTSHDGPPTTNPNKLWFRMSDSIHPGPRGHLAFYRDLAPYFGLPRQLSWEL